VFDQLTSKKKEFLSRTLSSIPEPKHQFRELVKTPLVRKKLLLCFNSPPSYLTFIDYQPLLPEEKGLLLNSESQGSADQTESFIETSSKSEISVSMKQNLGTKFTLILYQNKSFVKIFELIK
jgi:hypothetical protein